MVGSAGSVVRLRRSVDDDAILYHFLLRGRQKLYRPAFSPWTEIRIICYLVGAHIWSSVDLVFIGWRRLLTPT